MNTFLHTVAQDLVRRFGNNLSELTLVFPGKRASVFMNDSLFRCAQGPVWAPRYITIDEFFLRHSSLTPTEPIRNVCALYEVYRSLVPDAEPLDEFYGWGEILMNDFEDIDKHMVDAERLFANVSALGELDHVDYLSEEQKRAIEHFFLEFRGEPSKLKERFLRLWNIMPQLYRGLKERLRRDGSMYKGAIYREVAERLGRGELPDVEGTYAFVGFNVLDEVECRVFDAFAERQGKTLFYWDYDTYYIRKQADHEAGLFMRRNLRKYENALPEDCYDNLLRHPKDITFVATSSDNAQARYLPEWIRQHTDVPEHQRTIVLCNEGLMKSALHSVPSVAEEPDFAPRALNITMGFPLIDTPVHARFMTLLDQQCNQPDPQLADNAALLRWLSERMEELGLSLPERGLSDVYRQLYTEATFQVYCTVNQFLQLVDDGTLCVERPTLRRLLRQVLRTLSIPFHGEVDEGLQMMGLLEARNLDFRDVIMLSVEEGFLPKKADDTSLIPYCLKAAYGLDTVERKTAVFAYYFYRLLQRAEHITLVYNDNSAGTQQREASRYLRQLLADTDLPIRHIRLGTSIRTQPAANTQVTKDAAVMQQLTQRFDVAAGAKHNLSPSAINTYLRCPMQFYYQHVACIDVPRRKEDGIAPTLFGTIVHDSAEIIYKRLTCIRHSQTLEPDDIRPLTQEGKGTAEAVIDLVFFVDWFEGEQFDTYKHPAERDAFLQPYIEEPSDHELQQRVKMLYRDHPDATFTGTTLVIRNVIRRFVQTILRWDAAHAPITFRGLELSVGTTLDIDTPQGRRSIRTGGRIDRLDQLRIDGRDYLRIVDYKTGTPKASPTSLSDIFLPEASGAAHYYLQTFLYGMILAEREQLPVRPCLFYVTEAAKSADYTPDLKFGREPIEQLTPEMLTEYRQLLGGVIAEIFNPAVPFTPCQDTRACQYCDFQRLCKS